MSLFTIDPEKCNRDGLCQAVCPARIIILPEHDGLPEPIPEADALCLNCGHCLAVCPTGALTLAAMNLEDCPPLRREWLPGPEQTEHFLRARRSIRNYKPRPVPRELLERLIHSARFAPSGSNSQPVHWLVIEHRAEVEGLAALVIDWMRFMMSEHPELLSGRRFDRLIAAWEQGEDRIFRGAPHIIVAHAPQNDMSAQTACQIALTYLELAAMSLNLGACWAGYFKAAAQGFPPMLQALALPDGHQCAGAMMVGYPKFSYHRLPLRNEPRIVWR